MTVGTDTYITALQYADYASVRGITVNAATIEADLVLSADFINTYYDLIEGYALPSDDTDKIEALLKAANKACELQQSGRLTLSTTVMTGALVSSESKSLTGVGDKSVSYVEGSQVTYKPRVPELDLLMSKSGAINFAAGSMVHW